MVIMAPMMTITLMVVMPIRMMTMTKNKMTVMMIKVVVMRMMIMMVTEQFSSPLHRTYLEEEE